MSEWPERDIDKIAKGWSIAMRCSKERLKRVHGLETEQQLDDAVKKGQVVLETVCVFMHACVKRGQYKLPLEFWRILHAEYGIVVYPSAFSEDIEIQGLGMDVTFTEAYHGHIVMFDRCSGGTNPPPCPFAMLTEPPPAYQKETPKVEAPKLEAPKVA
ncbi:hypothetical protein CDV31_001970 [Fusarium ambrosium]|uniref:Uncharacterized protein n=1 Tax=Fusarium ambrosium TaxID=131363 RepID=A0A428UYE5_9HYPO|nr:hypothetical protein CDV31_001970 [Fusarium ambrosium]